MRVQERCQQMMRRQHVSPFEGRRIRWEMPQATFEALKSELRQDGVPVVSAPGEPPTHETRLYGFPVLLTRRFRLVVDE